MAGSVFDFENGLMILVGLPADIFFWGSGDDTGLGSVPRALAGQRLSAARAILSQCGQVALATLARVQGPHLRIADDVTIFDAIERLWYSKDAKQLTEHWRKGGDARDILATWIARSDIMAVEDAFMAELMVRTSPNMAVNGFAACKSVAVP